MQSPFRIMCMHQLDDRMTPFLHHWASTLISLACLFWSFPAHADFTTQVQHRMARYDAIDEAKHLTLGLHGRLTEAIHALETVVPRSQHTPLDAYILGNKLYALDWDKSFQYHKQAYEAYPHEPRIALEMAMQYHRRGKCQHALPLYESAAHAGLLDKPHYVLLAHCYMHFRNYTKAFDTLHHVDFKRQHTAVDIMIHEVFGKPKPLSRHNELLRQVRQGRQDKIAALLALALTWDTDWWNRRLNWQALEVDVTAIEHTFGPQSTQGREARLLLDVLRADTRSADAVKHHLTATQYVVGTGRLPANTFIALHVIALALKAQLLSVTEAQQRFAAPLRTRLHSATGDKHALTLLTFFAARLRDDTTLEQLNLHGWQRYNDPDHALGYVLRQLQRDAKKARHTNATLQAAIDAFPHDARFLGLAYTLAVRHQQATPELLSRLITAEYHGLKNDRARYSSTLRRYYAALYTMLHPHDRKGTRPR